MVWNITTVMGLLCLFQVKHYIADYPLQGKFMLGKFKTKGWVLPLLSHCLVHSVMTFGIAARYTSLTLALLLATLDGSIHFIMDRIKASPNMLGRYKSLSAKEYIEISKDNIKYKDSMTEFPERSNMIAAFTHRIKMNEELLTSNKYFWLAIGLDQMVHHLTHYLVIYLILKGG